MNLWEHTLTEPRVCGVSIASYIHQCNQNAQFIRHSLRRYVVMLMDLHLMLNRSLGNKCKRWLIRWISSTPNRPPNVSYFYIKSRCWLDFYRIWISHYNNFFSMSYFFLSRSFNFCAIYSSNNNNNKMSPVLSRGNNVIYRDSASKHEANKIKLNWITFNKYHVDHFHNNEWLLGTFL